jgi:hypothetical protein
MDWERIKLRLESIVNAPMKLSKIPLDQWNKLASAQLSPTQLCKSVRVEGEVYFLLEIQANVVYVLIVTGNSSLTSSEKQLIEFALDAYLTTEKIKSSPTVSDEEKTAFLVKEWVDLQLALQIKEAVLPDQLTAKLSLVSMQIPLLLYGGYSDSHHVSYKELKKLLESFFEADIILIPLMEKEWLILGAEALLTASEGEDKESVEDALASICSGLYEMLANEWLGECQLTIHYPQKSPAKTLLQVIVEMRETMRLG